MPYVELFVGRVSSVSWLSVRLVGDAAAAALTHANRFRLRTDGHVLLQE